MGCAQGQFLVPGRVRGEREADGGAEQAPRDLGPHRSFASKCSLARAPSRSSMSAGKIRFQMDWRLKMSALAGAQDRLYLSERSGPGRRCRKMGNIHPVCKAWPPLSSNQRDDCPSWAWEGDGGSSLLIEEKSESEIHSYVEPPF